MKTETKKIEAKEIVRTLNDLKMYMTLIEGSNFSEKIIDKRRTPQSIKIHYVDSDKMHGGCDHTTGILYFSTIMCEEIGFSTFDQSYKRQTPYVHKYCHTNLDCLVWLFCHEWQHLYIGQQNHHPLFFSNVEELYNRLVERLSDVGFYDKNSMTNPTLNQVVVFEEYQTA